MASTTGIELGPDTCLLAGVRPARSGGAEISALHRIDASEWPADDVAIGEALRSVRRSKRLPRRASVVAWGLPDGTVDDEVSRSALRPVEAAGFRIASILTPPQALALLAATRPRNSPSDAVAWLALNMHGVAIAIVRGSELLFSRTFQWKYDPNLASGKAQLLQRYTLISQLAPELRRGIDAVRQSEGLLIEAVVTCGDLPELRSLTMPLIEELDLEVETLDSTDGLQVARKARLDRFAESAPALRLAVAAALTPVARSPRAWGLQSAMRLAAASALIVALAWGVYSYWNVSPVHTTKPVPRQTAAVRPPGAGAPNPVLTNPPNPRPSPAARTAEPKALATTGRRDPQPPPVTRHDATPGPAASAPVPSSTVTMSPEEQSARSADTSSRLLASPATLTPDARPVPLKDALPKVDSILIDQNRRLALIDGAIVGVGDTVARRVVVQIERDAVVLREPSGRVVRVRLRAPVVDH